MIRKILRGWMKFAHFIAVINTAILLSLLFFLVLTPLGMLFRLLGKNIFAPEARQSSWIKRTGEEGNPERQF